MCLISTDKAGSFTGLQCPTQGVPAGKKKKKVLYVHSRSGGGGDVWSFKKLLNLPFKGGTVKRKRCIKLEVAGKKRSKSLRKSVSRRFCLPRVA